MGGFFGRDVRSGSEELQLEGRAAHAEDVALAQLHLFRPDGLPVDSRAVPVRRTRIDAQADGKLTASHQLPHIAVR